MWVVRLHCSKPARVNFSFLRPNALRAQDLFRERNEQALQLRFRFREITGRGKMTRMQIDVSSLYNHPNFSAVT